MWLPQRVEQMMGAVADEANGKKGRPRVRWGKWKEARMKRQAA